MGDQEHSSRYLYLIGVLKSRNKIVGYRLLQLKDKKYFDVNPQTVQQILQVNSNAVANLELVNGEIVGSQGSIDRYTAIRETRVSDRQIVIIKKVVINDDKPVGYLVTDYRYSALKFLTTDEIISICEPQGSNKIANGKIVENSEGTKFISAIQGNYDTMTISAELYAKTMRNRADQSNKPIVKAKKPVVDVKKPAEVEQRKVLEPKEQENKAMEKELNAQEIIKVTTDDFEYAYGYEVDDDGKWVKSGLPGYGVKFIGTDTYLAQPQTEIDGKPIVSLRNTFRDSKHIAIDLRGFGSLDAVKHFQNMCHGVKLSWVFLNSNVKLDDNGFKEMFNSQDVQIVSEPSQNLGEIADKFKIRTVRFKKMSMNSWFEDAVKASSCGKGMAVVLCGA